MTKIFTNDRERIKAAVKDEAKSFCYMMDYVDEPLGLDYTATKHGIRVRITVEVEGE